MGYLLIEAVHSDYQAVLQHALESGELIIDNSKMQVEAINKIVELVGQDTPIEATNRILSAYNKMHGCIRRSDELPSKFATRFRGLASEYIALAVTSSTDKESQLIGMILLENAKLDENTNNAIEIQLVTQSKQRKKDTPAANLKFSLELRNYLVEKLEELAKTTDSEPRLRNKVDLAKAIADVASELSSLENQEHANPTQEESAGHHILLEDVFNALSSLSSTPTITGTTIKTKVDKLSQQMSSMLTKRRLDNLRGTPMQNDTSDSKKRRIDALKSKSKCSACGEIGHWYKDIDCKLNKKDKLKPGVTIEGTLSAAQLSIEMNEPLKFEKKINSYTHGWGHMMAHPKPVICCWKLRIRDINDKPFEILFDIVEGDDPLVIGDNIL
eukprot:IDg4903t1